MILRRRLRLRPSAIDKQAESKFGFFFSRLDRKRVNKCALTMTSIQAAQSYVPVRSGAGQSLAAGVDRQGKMVKRESNAYLSLSISSRGVPLTRPENESFIWGKRLANNRKLYEIWSTECDCIKCCLGKRRPPMY